MLAASVDAVKNPILQELNITLHTANVASLMFCLGYNALEVGTFLN
jgi:energy-converting hydrogenase Eha subunit E